MSLLVGILALEFAKEIVKETAKDCYKQHKEDILNAVHSTVKTGNKICEEGWQRDYNSGGISSWGRQYGTATA